WIHGRCLSKKGFKIIFLFNLFLQSCLVIASQPTDNFVDFFFRSIFAFCFFNVEWIYICKFHCEHLLFRSHRSSGGVDVRSAGPLQSAQPGIELKLTTERMIYSSCHVSPMVMTASIETAKK